MSAVFNMTYYTGQDHYSDGTIEDEILAMIQGHVADPELAADRLEQAVYQDQRWPVVYHLAGIRENILNWFPFKPGCSILEIGGGLGAITGALCQRAARVVSVEWSLQRARCLQARHHHHDNLEIIVGDFRDLDPAQVGTFDFVTVIGVLEYAGTVTAGGDVPDPEPGPVGGISGPEPGSVGSVGDFHDPEPGPVGGNIGGDPYQQFLDRVRSFLKPDGQLLLAIENQFGLKYWCGAAEDHTGVVYDGLRGYDSGRPVRTFSRQALRSLLGKSGFHCERFYYPLPDYKLPQVIFSDQYLPSFWNARRYRPFYDQDTFVNFTEHSVIGSLIENQVFEFFANSFLVLASVTARSTAQASQPEALPPVDYVVFNNERRRPYRCATVLRKHHNATKVPLVPEAAGHLAEMSRISDLLRHKGVAVAPETFRNGQLETPFLTGSSLEQHILTAIFSQDRVRLPGLIGRYYRELLKLAHPDEVARLTALSLQSAPDYAAANTCQLEQAPVDMTFANCFDQDGQLIFFDQEWLLSNLPLGFVAFRSVNNLYISHPQLAAFWPQAAFWQLLGMPKQEIARYQDFECRYMQAVIDPQIQSFLENHTERGLNQLHAGLLAQVTSDYEAELARQQAEQQQALGLAVADYEQEIKRITSEQQIIRDEQAFHYEQEIARQQAEQLASRQQLCADYEREIMRITAEQETLRLQMMQTYETEVDRLQTEHQQLREQLIRTYEIEIARLSQNGS